MKQEWGGQPFFPGTGALEETGEYQVGTAGRDGTAVEVVLQLKGKALSVG